MRRLVLVLGDQLSHALSALRAAGDDDVVVMAEVRDEASYVPHHPKKIALIYSAMRHFAEELRARGGMSAIPAMTMPRMRGRSRANCCAGPRRWAHPR